MKRIVAATLSIFSLMFPPSAIALATTTPATQVQIPAQVDKRELIAVAAKVTRDKNYQLALEVANNVIELFPNYATGYLYRAIAQYRLGEEAAAKVAFTQAKQLYLTQLKSAKISIPEKNEAHSGLEVAELHLQLLSSQP